MVAAAAYPRINCRWHGAKSTVRETEYEPLVGTKDGWPACYVCIMCAFDRFAPREGNYLPVTEVR